MTVLDEITDGFTTIFGESRGHGIADGITPQEDAALRRVIWQSDVAAKLLRTKTYEYARVALSRLRSGESRDDLWCDRSAPGGVVFSGALAALRAAGLYPASAKH